MATGSLLPHQALRPRASQYFIRLDRGPPPLAAPLSSASESPLQVEDARSD